MADCIKSAGLKTFLIAKTGTPDPTYKPHFYGGPLQASPRVTLLTLALTLTLTLTLSLALTLP
jgi:hypothetical protein